VGAGEGSASSSPPGVKPGVLSALLQELAAAPETQGEPLWEPALRPGDVVGRFELLRELGRGGFGVVWEARDQELGRKVAFKLVRAGRAEAGADQLHREAEAVARLQHPNLVTLYDVGRCEHGPYLVLELLRGETLQARLARGPLPLGEALAVAVEVARGLAHAHAEGVVHRDLKPSNVFLCERGGVKLLDFGMAHAFGRKRVSGGTPAYMAPEQWRDAPEDERTDVFALGVMLYRMITGTLPFPDDGGKSARDPKPAPELEVHGAPALGPLVARMLTKDPAARIREGGAALAELEGIAAELPHDAPAAAAPVVVRRPWSRRRRVTAAIAIAAAIALGAAAPFLVRRPPATSGPPSVAVLPFADLSPQHDQDYFSDGIAEEILNALAQVEGLHVTGRTSSFSFKGKQTELAEIGRRLNVAHVLEGSVRKAGSRVRITAQLVNTSDGFHLWSRTFDHDLTDIFAVQEEIARDVVEALKVKLLPGREPTTRWTKTSNPEVYNQYLLGQEFRRRGTLDGYRHALLAFEKALTLDPGFAPAWAGIAVAADTIDSLSDEPQPELGRRAVAAAERAMALAPELPEAYYARALVRIDVFDWAGAMVDVERALSLSPNYAWAEQLRAALLTYAGRLEEALAAARRATELEPLHATFWARLGAVYNASNELDRAREALTRALEISPENEFAQRFLAWNLLNAGRAKDALAAAERLGSGADRLFYEALAQHELGNAKQSQAALDTFVARHAGAYAYRIAEIYAWRGERDRAFEWLERAYVQHDGNLEATKIDSSLRRLHDDPRWKPFLKKMNLPVD
jgi:TolB-like protein/tetratricopeptide (TPR) repeat protein